jgi:hypothetical protein
MGDVEEELAPGADDRLILIVGVLVGIRVGIDQHGSPRSGIDARSPGRSGRWRPALAPGCFVGSSHSRLMTASHGGRGRCLWPGSVDP